MSTVGDSAWKDVLDTKGLSAAAPILEEYGLSCESDMSLVDEEDLVILCSKVKPFQSKLLSKWVQGLGDEQRAAAFMKDASAANKHSTSAPVEDKGEEDEDEEENGDADADEDSDEEDKEVHGGASGEQGAGDGKSDEDVRIIGEQSAQHHMEDGKRATEGVNDAATAKKAKTSTLSTEQQSFVCRFNPVPAKIDKERKIATRHVKGRLNSLKKQGARLNDVKGATIANSLQEFSGNFLSLVSGQLWCAACFSNVGSAKSAVDQH
jgi:cobalamin biosynthesis protein CobT